jgi:hypothetical protein
MHLSMLKYWKWTEDVLKYYESILKKTHIQDSIFSSIFTYDWQINVIRFFYNHRDSLLTFKSHIYVFIYFDDNNTMKIKLIIYLVGNKC